MKTVLLIQIPFDGFYESAHNTMIDDEINGLFQNDQGKVIDMPENFWDEVDYKKLYLSYAKEYATSFQNRLASLNNTLQFKSLSFESLSSPKEYNFTTDRIFCTVSPEDISSLYAATNEKDLRDKIRECCTSRDGFSSFYSNDRDDWPKDVLLWDHNQLHILLASFIDQENVNLDAWDIMEDDRGNGIIASLVWDNISPAGKAAAEAWTLKHHPKAFA